MQAFLVYDAMHFRSLLNPTLLLCFHFVGDGDQCYVTAENGEGR